MDALQWIKNISKEQAAHKMVEMVNHVSPETFMKLTLLASRLSESGETYSAVEAVRRSLEEGPDSQASRMFRRVMTEVHPDCLKAVARTLFVNGLLRSGGIREEFGQQHGFYPPFTLLISPTMRCNLQCRGCYAGRYDPGKGLSVELLDRILGEARNMGILFITFSGGEPLTRKKDLLPLIEKYNDMYFMFYTNGTLIDDRTADDLQRLGNAGAVVSLEGFKEATDYRRGEGVYQRVMDAMDRLRSRGVPFGTSLTVTSRNVEELTSDAFFEHLYNKGVMVAWYFLFMPVGKDPDTSLMPSPQQREYLRQRDAELRAKYPIFIADFWNDAPYVGGCIAGGRHYLHITASGDVEPCVFTHVAVDKIFDKSLPEVLSSDFFRTIRSRQPYTNNMLTPCMIIDNPHVFREICEQCGAHPTHEGAEDVRKKICSELDRYGEEVRALFRPIWEKEKGNYGYETEEPPSKTAVV